MTMQTCDPLQARQWFKLREAVNFAAVIGGFIVLDAFLWLIAGGFIAGTVSIAVMFCVFFFILHKRAIGIECPSCGKYILTNTPWICGFCGAKNFRVDDYPFVGRCGNKECGAEPKAYQCHHCEKLIFFTPDRQKFNFAKSVNIPDKSRPVEVKKDERGEVAARVQLKELMVKEAGYDVELKNLRQNLEPPPKEKTAFEQLEEYYKGMMGNEDAAKKWHAAIDAEFPNDPVERERRHEVVKQWMANKL
jgi:hypothetical protein